MKTGLGTWRFFLAFLVAISHLWAGMIDGPAAYAVWGFFVLSGFLMTLVLTTKYRTATAGIRQFALNRLLRIYPPFIVAGGIGIATILTLNRVGIDPAALNPQFRLPQGGGEWLNNLTMFPFVSQQGLPVPVAAALFVEVWAYALMPLFAKSKAAAVLGLAVAFCANVQFGFGMSTFVARYCGFATGLMPFAFGAVVCHYRGRLQRFASPSLSVLTWCLHGLYWLVDAYWPWTYGLWVSVPLSAWVVLSLVEIKPGPLDKRAGELSYPIYLLHTTIAAWLLPHFGFGRSLLFFVLSFVATLAASFGMVWLVDRPAQYLRSRLESGWLCERSVSSRSGSNEGQMTEKDLEPYKIPTGPHVITSTITKVI